MASMYRNTNLEEIEVDSFLGIEFLKYQTLPQKIVFVGGFVCGGAMLLVSTLLFHLGTMLSLLISFPFLIISIAFGCNYNQDLSLIRYLVLLLRDPVTKLGSLPTEDLNYIRRKAKDFAEETEVDSDEQSAEEQQKLLRRFILIIVALVVFLVVSLAAIFIFKDTGTGVHHTIS